jgi:hypothetical protein
MGTAASAPVEKPQHITVEFDVRMQRQAAAATAAAVFLEQAACIMGYFMPWRSISNALV